MNEYLILDDLRLTLGDFALKGIDLSMAKNDYLVLLGPTGCGKTSLLRSIAGIYRPDAGRITLEGRDITELPSHRRRVGYVSQMTDLFPHLDVRGNVGFGLKYLGLSAAEGDKRVKKLLDVLETGHLSKRDVSTLSGGETKKVAIARSLVAEPDLLLLDEPLGMLDPNVRADVLEILKLVHSDLQTTTIHVTHERSEAWAMGAGCAVMSPGEVQQTGPVAEVFRRPKNVFIARFLGGANIFPASFTTEGGRAKARLSWGEIEIEARPPFGTGHLVIRPENIRLSERPEDAVVSGRATGVLDRGTNYELTAAVGQDIRITMLLPLGSGRIPKAGEEVHLTWDRSDAWPLPPEEQDR